MPTNPVSTLHFDLSHTPPDAEHTLSVAGKEYPLSPHTAETRKLHAPANLVLQAVPRDQQQRISHFAVGVELPDNMALMLVQHTSSASNAPLPALSLLALHIPQPARKPATAPFLANRKLVLMGAAPLPADTDPDLANDHAHDFKTPLDTAISLVSMHPELMNLDPDTAAHIHDNHIASATGINDLALSVSQQGAADVDGGWATISPCVDLDGKIVPGADGNPVYRYALSDDTRRSMAGPVKAALRSTKDDMALKDKVWSSSYGVTSVDHSAGAPSPATPSGRPKLMAAAPSTNPPATGDQAPWTARNMSSVHGIDVFPETLKVNAATGDASIEVRNTLLRHVGVYVQSLNDQGQPLDGSSQSSIMMIAPGNYLLGIPLPTGNETISFKLDRQASGARISFGSLGSYDFDIDVDREGIIYTAIFEMALPMLFLVGGFFIKRSQGYKNLMADPDVAKAIYTIAVFLIVPKFVVLFVENPTKGAVALANQLTPAVLSGGMGKAITEFIAYQWGEESGERAIPIVGLVMEVIGICGSLAELAETTAAIIQNPATTRIELARTMTLKIGVLPDPEHSVWPSTSVHYRIMVQYKGGTFQHQAGEMSTITHGITSSAQLNVTFNNVPAGGELMVYAVIYSGNYWICGYAATDWISALPDSTGTLTIPAFAIKERLVPLSKDTQYSHNEKLGYDATSGHHWVAASGTPPTETKTSLDDSPILHSLSELTGITINDRAHMLGYSWRASGQSLPFDAGGAVQTDVQMYAFQNISYLGNPQSAYQASNLGFSANCHILYDQFGPLKENATGTGSNFFLDVRGSAAHLRRITLDSNLSFDLTKPMLSWGKFSQPNLDAVVVHPAGYVVAASWTNSKLEILKIPAAGAADAAAPVAVLCSGAGVREGLTQGPIALAVTPDGRILVLETLNNRIQAFDTSGNPVKYFGDQTNSLSYMALKQRPGITTYLDLGTESKGYIYVLSHTGTGANQTDYNLDIYEPEGNYLCTTNGLNAAKLVVSMWRDVYALNYEKLSGPNGRTEPSVSQWIPSTPPGSNPDA